MYSVCLVCVNAHRCHCLAGLTKAVIPILQKHNISGVSVGINGAAAYPAVPPYPFLWKLEEEDSTGVVAFWHMGGLYGWRNGSDD